MSENPPDTLNEIGVLKRREIEARILMPVLKRLGAVFGEDRVFAVTREVIVEVAREQGRALAEQMGGNSLEHLADSLENWKKGDALRLETLERTSERFSFNVTRCRYAELYQSLGIPEVGALLSCNRDFSLVEGFNEDITLTRTQTIMGGASHCDFRYVAKPSGQPPSAVATRSSPRQG
jgi:L-2-amino-thiazoline-4-carboxylic acid hydrolase